MSYSPYLEACAKKFALFLHEKKCIKQNAVYADIAYNLFKTDFQPLYQTKTYYGSILSTLGKYHLVTPKNKTSDVNVIQFDPKNLQKLIQNKEEIDKINDLVKMKIQKRTFVSQSFAFRTEKSEESLHSEKGCKLCNVKFLSKTSHEKHLKGATHIFVEEFYKTLRQPAKKSKDDQTLKFSIPNFPSIQNIVIPKGSSTEIKLDVTNQSKEIINIMTITTNNDIKEIYFKPLYPVNLLPANSVQFILKVMCNTPGIIYFPMLFKTSTNGKDNLIPIELVFHVHNNPAINDLHPVQPYRRISKPILTEYIKNIDEGERLKSTNLNPFKKPLKPYHLVSDLTFCLNAGLKPFPGITKPQTDFLNDLKALLDVEDKLHCLNVQNYTKLLDVLLFIEEHQMQINIRDYDCESVLKPLNSDLLELEVLGLAEHRPSLILGDSVSVRLSRTSNEIFRGYVHKVNETSVWLKFSARFRKQVFIKGMNFFVSFNFNRNTLRTEHQAVELAKIDDIANLLFPAKIPREPLETMELQWINRNIAANLEQQQAIRCILQKTAKPAPYLVFGPPGTGKTMTVVEAVKQIHKLTNQKILICTPSNNAANEVARRLDGLPTTDLFRYIAISFPYRLIPSEVLKYSNFKNGEHYYQTKEALVKYRIVITTLSTASKLINTGCPSGHFDYVFIDESGQATETETLIAIAGILSSFKTPGKISGQIVLAGDPKQLGPIIHSKLAIQYGFGTSMLERLMESPSYQKHEPEKKYNHNALTKLVKNYRSHPVIIQPSNELFYDMELEPAGDNMINLALNWSGLPNKNFPMIFHNVIGLDQRERHSPSFFNIQEIDVVASYLEELIGSKLGGRRIQESDIGVISPYKKQVEKIGQLCAKKQYNREELFVGTIEQIQGQERLIIIISVVRSRPEFITHDHKFHLGFLKNPKRFNVAITRAKALVIVIGNPNILQHDPNWRSLLKYCKDNNAMKGVPFSFEETKEEEEIINGVVDLTLDDDEANPDDGPGFSRGNQ